MLNYMFIVLIIGRKLLREWIKHRYGVFDETGFHSDDQYPEQELFQSVEPIANECATFQHSTR